MEVLKLETFFFPIDFFRVFLNLIRLPEQCLTVTRSFFEPMSFFKPNDMIFVVPWMLSECRLLWVMIYVPKCVLMIVFVIWYKLLHNFREFGILMVWKEDLWDLSLILNIDLIVFVSSCRISLHLFSNSNAVTGVFIRFLWVT